MIHLDTPDTPTYPLFSINAAYQAARSASADELLNDVSLLLESIKDTLETLAMSLQEDGYLRSNPAAVASMLFGASYLTRLAAGASDNAHNKILRAKLGVVS